ncbi:MAG TPA: hypothetical protein VFH15_08770 [Pyrinomonadaceae bacterium]|nr:hypothetical protein [Pyrinomonadaceae bacterium]
MANLRAIRVISAGIDSYKLGSCLAVLIFALGFASCATADKPKTETAPAVIAHTEEVALPATVPPPEINDVKAAVKRVFKDSVELDSSRKPIFIDGDFNGDSSRDLAVVIKPAPNKLADLNEEFPNWILKDPFSGDVPHVPRLRVAADDTLLAVIHGYGTNGWRDPEATQTFLLKNAVGSGMTIYQAKDLTKANKAKKTPYLRGDVISQTVDRTPGYLYFAGATYSWYDARTFNADKETGMAHLRQKKVK